MKKIWDFLRSSRATPYIVLLFVTANIGLLVWVVAKVMPDYPTGWDSPYYISRIRFFEEQGVLANRIGFITTMSLIHRLIGGSIVNLYLYVCVATSALLGLASALLAWRTFGKNMAAFCLSFLFVFWSQTFFAMSITTVDNALGLAAALFALYLVAMGIDTWRTAAAFFMIAGFVAVTHFESAAFLLFTAAVSLVIRMIAERSFMGVVRKSWPLIIALGLAALLLVAQWWNIFSGIISSYTTQADPTGNASIPYAQSSSFTDFLKYFRYGLVTNLEILLAILAAASVGIAAVRDKQRAAYSTLAYLVVTYGVLAFSILRSSIPINRSLLLLPVPFLLSLGVFSLADFFRRKNGILAAVLTAMALMYLLNPVPDYIRYTQLFPVSISPSTYKAMLSLNHYIEKEKIDNIVIVADIPSDERASSAFYGLWNYWLTSVLPIPKYGQYHCLYMGKPNEAFGGKPTIRLTQSEYLPTSEVGVECIHFMKAPPRYFVLAGMAGDSYTKHIKNTRARVIDQYLTEIEPLPADQQVSNDEAADTPSADRGSPRSP